MMATARQHERRDLVQYAITRFLNGHRSSLLASLLLPSVLCLGCGGPAPLTVDMPLHLEDHLAAATIVGSEVPAEVVAPVEWRFDELQPEWTVAVPWNPTIEPAQLTQIDDALRVTLTASTTFPSDVGKQWWVGQPQEVCENSGQDPSVPPAACGSAPGIPKLSMWSSALQCVQHCMDWHTLVDRAGNLLDVLHIGHPDIVTGSVYEIEAVDCVCDASDKSNYSAPLPVSTAKWGDTVGPSIAGCPYSDPNGGLINLILDCVAIINKFQNKPCAPLKSRADIDPSNNNRVIDFIDVNRCVGAFRGGGYPYQGPVGCP